MTTLRDFEDLRKYIDEYGCVNFVETGTNEGNSLDYAISYGMKEYWSIELVKDLYERAVAKYSAMPNVHILNGNSPEVLAELLPKIDGPILFWIDAHFPNGECDASDVKIQLPLKEEMELIFNLRGGKDVILIDDWEMFWPGYSGYKVDKGFYDESFLNPFRNTHIITEIKKSNGYLEMLPK